MSLSNDCESGTFHFIVISEYPTIGPVHEPRAIRQGSERRRRRWKRLVNRRRVVTRMTI